MFNASFLTQVQRARVYMALMHSWYVVEQNKWWVALKCGNQPSARTMLITERGLVWSLKRD